MLMKSFTRIVLLLGLMLSLGILPAVAVPIVRGYPETFSHCCSEIKQHLCGNETQGDHRERVCSA
jgi:hypothetical protein